MLLDDRNTPTATLARFASEFRLDALSSAAIATVKVGILDSIGVALAGSNQPAGRAVADFVAGHGAGPASLWGHGVRVPVSLAALANGTAAHALDYDDVNWALTGHPSVGLTPAVFALAERDHASGSAILEAYACGFEVMAKVGLTCMPAHSYTGGWHATSTIGTIGATAACCRLLGLNVDQATHAVGIAVSRAAGVVQNFGTMTKPLHAGSAAENGVIAAELARRGFTASPDAMEGKHGFYASFCRDLPLHVEHLQELGTVFELDESGLLIKPYPCGVAGHAAIDAARKLRSRLTLADIETASAVTVGATAYTLDKMRYIAPENELQAKFSLTYQVARALLDGNVRLAHFEATAIRDERVRTLASRIVLTRDDDIDLQYTSRGIGGVRPCRVTITLADGRSESELVRASRGDPESPMTHEQLEDKFGDCAGPVLGLAGVRLALDLLNHLEAVADCQAVCDLIRGSNQTTS